MSEDESLLFVSQMDEYQDFIVLGDSIDSITFYPPSIFHDQEGIYEVPGDHERALLLDQKLSSYLIDSGVIVIRDELYSAAQLWIPASDKFPYILVESNDMPPGVFRLKTLLHETAHYIWSWRHPGISIGSYEDGEAISEGAAQDVMAFYEFDTEEYGERYFERTGVGQDVKDRIYEERMNVASELLRMIEVGNLTPES